MVGEGTKHRRRMAKGLRMLAALGAVLATLVASSASYAQRDPVHYFQSADAPPGAAHSSVTTNRARFKCRRERA